MLTFKPIPLWKQLLRTNFVRWNKLAEFLELSEDQCSLIDVKPHFSLNLPLRLASKIPKGTIDDPIFKQFIPTMHEKESFALFFNDPTCDITHQKTPKLLQKYDGRALLICTSACAMHCRYCFRQNYPYETSQGHAFELELEEISRDTALREIILSGGDPLSLSDDVLQSLLRRLSVIPHIRRIRFHTRFPMGIPERIDEAFLKILGGIQKQLWFVIHANHSNEFDQDIWLKLKEIQKLGIPVLCQSVLLQGINDDVDALKRLCEDLVDHGVLPYYLHQLDRVQGAAHFEVTQEKGLWLVEQLRKQLSGYAVPLYVQEISGELSKTPL
ncbi:MAG: KamA family radical SAM protein [Parachlamydiaceae bacterium]|nr:KamA family radical SAM protein [Parachlamydiaceae bacterium]